MRMRDQLQLLLDAEDEELELDEYSTYSVGTLGSGTGVGYAIGPRSKETWIAAAESSPAFWSETEVTR